MIKRKASPVRLCAGLLALFFALAFLLLAVRDNDSRLYLLAAVVPGVLLLFSCRFMSRLLSLDRLLSVFALVLCALGVLALAPDATDAALSHALSCAVALVFLLAGTILFRALRPSLPVALVPAGVSLGLLAVPLFTDMLPFPVSDFAGVLLLIAFVSLLSMRFQLFAMLFALGGMALLLAQGSPVSALVWGITFLLLFWAYAGHPVILAAGTVAACVLVSAARFLLPDLLSAGNPLPLYAALRPGLFGPVSFDEPLVAAGTSPSALFPLIAGRYGWIFAGCVLLLYPVMMKRGVSLARAARSRFHGLLAMGAVLLVSTDVIAALMCDVGIIASQQVSLPGLTGNFPALCAFLFLIGLLGGVSARNQADLEEDVHLAMLAD